MFVDEYRALTSDVQLDVTAEQQRRAAVQDWDPSLWCKIGTEKLGRTADRGQRSQNLCDYSITCSPLRVPYLVKPTAIKVK